MAEYFSSRGADVLVLHEDHGVRKVRTPDVVIRWSGLDPGTALEIKTLERPSAVSVKRNILEGAEQVARYGGGDVVLDARNVDSDDETVRRGYGRAVGEARTHGKSMPRRTFVIMPGDRLVELGREKGE